MALKRMHRGLLVAGALALTALAVLPPRPYPDEEGGLGGLYEWTWQYWSFTRFRSYDESLKAAREGFVRQLHMRRFVDSLATLLVGPRALRSADGSLTVLYGDGLRPDSARVWLQMLERELALVPYSPGGGIPIVVRLFADSARDRNWTVPVAQQQRILRFVSPRPARAACIVEANLLARSGTAQGSLVTRDQHSGLTRTDFLDWCALYGRFGMPGALVGRWASPQLEVSYWKNSSFTDAIAEARRPRREPWLVATEYGQPFGAACARGAQRVCLREVGLQSGPGYVRNYGYWSMWGVLPKEAFVAHLIVADPTRFEAFWRSSEAPAPALTRAYNRPAGAIVAAWAAGRIKVSRPGPEFAAAASTTSLLYAVVAIALGALVFARRQVEP